MNIYTDEIPKSDYVLLMASLYQFFPDHNMVLKKLFNAASKYLIISEPIINYAESRSRIISYISNKLNNPGDGVKKYRFNLNTLKEAMEPFQNCIVSEFFISNNIEYVFVIKK